MNASVDLYCEFFNTRLLCRETGRFTKASTKQAKQRTPILFQQFTFLWFILSCLLKFLFLFFKNIKLSQQLFICVCSSFMDIKLLSSGFKITEPQTKKTSFSNTIYIYKIVIDIFLLVIICKLFSFRIFLSAFFHPNFVIRIRYPHPSSAGIRSSFYRHPFSTGFTREFKQRCVFQLITSTGSGVFEPFGHILNKFVAKSSLYE